jgi:hypothetical protein
VAASIAAALVLVAGCGANHAEIAAVRGVAKEWLRASTTGDGQTYCALLAPSIRQRVDAGARQLGPHVTCAESQSSHPPGLSKNELKQLAEDREQVYAGLRIDSVSLHGSKATVHYSWRAPTHPPPNLGYNRPVDGRVHGTLTLVRLKGKWRIG